MNTCDACHDEIQTTLAETCFAIKSPQQITLQATDCQELLQSRIVEWDLTYSSTRKDSSEDSQACSEELGSLSHIVKGFAGSSGSKVHPNRWWTVGRQSLEPIF